MYAIRHSCGNILVDFALNLPIMGKFLTFPSPQAVDPEALALVAGPRAATAQAIPVSDASRTERQDRSDPFSRAYRSLRQDLACGAAYPGDQLVVIEAARRLGISPTPVREALARLSGERLVEDRRRHGYFVPLPSWFDLVELHDLCEMHIVASIREASRARDIRGADNASDLDVALGSDALAGSFCALLHLSRNGRLMAAGRTYIECLGGARRTEVRLFGAEEARAARLRGLAEARMWREAIHAVHQIFRTHRNRAEPVAHAMAAAHRARNRANIV